MRERQYSFLFRGNCPSTPSAANTAHDFARSCRKLELSEPCVWGFPCTNNDVSSCVRIVQEFRAVENEAQRWDLIAEAAIARCISTPGLRLARMRSRPAV